MKSVALLDSTPQDDDFVLISNISDLDTNDGEDCDFLDDYSYDYCVDVLSLSSMHQAITSTSNPLQVVQENFFSETKPVAAPSTVSVERGEDSLDSNANILDSDQDYRSSCDDEAEPSSLMSSLSSSQPHQRHPEVQDSTGIFVIDASSADDEASSSSAILSEQDRSDILKAVEENDDILPLESDPLPSSSSASSSAYDEGRDDGVEAVFATDDLDVVAPGSSENDNVIITEKKDTNPIVLDENLPSATCLTVTPPLQIVPPPSSDDEAKASQEGSLSVPDLPSSRKTSKKKRRKQLKIAKKAAAAAAAAAALGQFATLRSSTTSSKDGSPLSSPTRNVKRKGKNKKVANIAVMEAVKSHNEYNKQVAAMNKKLR